LIAHRSRERAQRISAEERLAGAAAWARIAHSQCSADGSEGLAALPHLRDALKLFDFDLRPPPAR
jgi:hypothetical protein